MRPLRLAGVTKYPNVKNAHVVPQTYLVNWTIDDKIATWLLPEGKRLPDQSVENVGTRRRFYERTRPGSDVRINDIEAMLGEGESRATPLLRSFAEKWPLATVEKIQLAELFGYQLLRGPRWKLEGAGASAESWLYTSADASCPCGPQAERCHSETPASPGVPPLCGLRSSPRYDPEPARSWREERVLELALHAELRALKPRLRG
jgi:hypothetical protein